MNIREWRASKPHVLSAQKLLELQAMADLLDMLEESQPHKLMTVPMGNQYTDSRMLGMVEGYNLCLTNIRTAAKAMERIREPKADYPDPNKDN